jgi:hypothetical protein
MAIYQLTINLDFFVHKCQAAIQSRLHELQLVLNAHETGVAGTMGVKFKADSGITITVAAPDNSNALQNAFQNALLGANRDFIRYCEEMMAIRRISREGLRNITSDMEGIPAGQVVTRIINERAAVIGQNTKIKAPDKVKEFLSKADPVLRIAESHTKLRNCIEHHYCTPKKNLSVIAYSMSINVRPGDVVNKGDMIEAKFQERTIQYPERKRISFQYDDVKDIITTTEQVLLNAVHRAMLAERPQKP